jgi:hypothetical protein
MYGSSANAATIGKATEGVKERGPSARARWNDVEAERLTYGHLGSSAHAERVARGQQQLGERFIRASAAMTELQRKETVRDRFIRARAATTTNIPNPTENAAGPSASERRGVSARNRRL